VDAGAHLQINKIQAMKLGFETYVVILNTIIPLISCWKLARCLLISIRLENKIRSDAVIRDIRFLMSDDRELYELAVRLLIILFLLGNLIVFLNGVSRILNDIWYYPNLFMTITATIFGLLMLGKAHIFLMFFRGDNLSFVKKLFFNIQSKSRTNETKL
jgi:hypothetical protein